MTYAGLTSVVFDMVVGAVGILLDHAVAHSVSPRKWKNIPRWINCCSKWVSIFFYGTEFLRHIREQFRDCVARFRIRVASSRWYDSRNRRLATPNGSRAAGRPFR